MSLSWSTRSSFQCFYLHLAFIDRTIFPKDFLNVQVSVKLYFGAKNPKLPYRLEGKLAVIRQAVNEAWHINHQKV